MTSITITCLCLLIGCVAVSAAVKRIIHFDCRRSGHDCVGVNCIGPGCAVCPTGKHGYDCSLSYTAPKDNDKPECQCKNGGTCYIDGSNYKCECSPEHYGDKCQYQRLTVMCNGDCMTMGVNPVASFSGSIWMSSTGNCNFKPVDNTVLAHWKGYFLTVCKDETKCPYTIDQDKRKANVTIQYGSSIINHLDSTMQFVCSQPPTLTLKTSSVVVKKPDAQYSHIKTEFTPTNPLVTLKATQNNKVVKKVSLGSLYDVELELDTKGAYTTLVIESLTVKNSDGDEKKIISFRCRLSAANNVMPKKYPRRGPSNKLAVQMKAFFLGTKIKTINYVAVVTVCKSTLDPYCSQVTCKNRKRKRRSTDEIGLDRFSPSREQYVLRTEVEITDDDHDVYEGASDEQSMTVVGLFIGGCSLAAVVIVAIVVVVCSRKNRKEIPHKRFENIDN